MTTAFKASNPHEDQVVDILNLPNGMFEFSCLIDIDQYDIDTAQKK